MIIFLHLTFAVILFLGTGAIDSHTEFKANVFDVTRLNILSISIGLSMSTLNNISTFQNYNML